MKSPIEKVGGKSSWTSKAGDSYRVTGVDRSGNRFCFNSPNWRWIESINVWRGTRWLIRDNKKFKIQSIFN